MVWDRPDIPSVWPPADEQLRGVFLGLLEDGSWGRYHGPHSDALRLELQSYHGVSQSVLCCSGTAAVELSLRAAGVGPGDEVVMCAYDFKANLMNVRTCGGMPVLVDTEPGRPVPDLELLKAAVTSRTKAILVSHLHGLMVPMRGLREFCDSRALVLIEDACQNPGAMVDGRRAGAWGDLGVLSFGGSKLLTAGRGGAILTSSRVLAQRIALYTQRGNEAYPLSEMQAAVVLPQLRQLDVRNRQRAAGVDILRSQLKEQRVLSLLSMEDVSQAVLEAGAVQGLLSVAAYYKVAFRVTDEFPAELRETIVSACEAAGIPLSPGCAALQTIHARSLYRSAGVLDQSAALGQRLLVLHHPVLLAGVDVVEGMGERLASVLRTITGAAG